MPRPATWRCLRPSGRNAAHNGAANSQKFLLNAKRPHAIIPGRDRVRVGAADLNGRQAWSLL